MPDWKLLLLPLAVLVPLLAYVAGTLTADADRPAIPEPVILRETQEAEQPPSKTPGKEGNDRRGDDPARNGDNDEGDDPGENEARDDADDDPDDDEPRVVVPEPTEVEEDDDDGTERDDD